MIIMYPNAAMLSAKPALSVPHSMQTRLGTLTRVLPSQRLSTIPMSGRKHTTSGKELRRPSTKTMWWLCAARQDDEIDLVQQVVLGPATQQSLAADATWLARHLQVWLDEEWIPQDVHRDLGAFAGQAYINVRQAGNDELGDLVLSLSSELQGFNYRETFTNAFEVANKIAELMMLQLGREVCCISSDNMARFERINNELER